MAEIIAHQFFSNGAQKILRLPKVLEQTGVASSTLYERMTEGLFPRPVRISKRSSGWPSGEIEAYNRAIISGKSDTDIRSLVSKMVEQRTDHGTRL